MDCSGLVRAGWCPGLDAPLEVKPWLAPWQAQGPAPVCSPPGRGGVTSLAWTNAHSSLGTCEKEITQALQSAHSPYIQFLPLPPQLFTVCFCAAVGRNRTVWVPSRAEGSSPARWCPGQSLSASASSPEPCIDGNAGEMLLSSSGYYSPFSYFASPSLNYHWPFRIPSYTCITRNEQFLHLSSSHPSGHWQLEWRRGVGAYMGQDPSLLLSIFSIFCLVLLEQNPTLLSKHH